MSTVDDLVGSLFPDVKLPPPTKVSGSASSAVGNDAAAQQQQKQPAKPSAGHNFDDSDDDDNNTNDQRQQNQIQKKTPPAGVTGPPPRMPTSASAGIGNSGVLQQQQQQQQSKQQQTAQPVLKFSTTTVQWPVLPKNLLQVCPRGVSCVLTNNVPDHSARVHSRLLFGASGPTTQQDASKEHDSSVMDLAAGTVNFCAFMRCNKCGHPVVRMQNAFVVQSLEQQKQLRAAKSASTDGGAQHQQDQKKKQKSENHNWDDSDDEGEDSSGSGSGGGLIIEGSSLDPMYMLSRNHYPDFTRLDRAGALRRVDSGNAATMMCGMYWCQCTMVSCFSRRAMIDAANSAETNAAVLEPPAAVKEERAAAGEVPFSTREIKWQCFGHLQPM